MNEAKAGRRVAFFGGSFDPPHIGHLAVARAARAGLGLDTVLFAPVGAQPLKPAGASASYQDRVTMTRLALAGEPGFDLSLADAPKPNGAPNYTLETLLALGAELAPDGALFFLIGADAFAGIRSWRRAAEIPFAAPLIVASRPGLRLESLRSALPEGLTMELEGTERSKGSDVEVCRWLLRNATGDTVPFFLLPGLHFDVSASEVRRQVRASSGHGQAETGLLSAAVAEYIRAHGLYR